MRQVTANVYVETGFRGCNPGFVTTREGVVMIDSPFRPSDAVKWRDEIAKKGEVRYLINTEPHGDHTVGNYFFPGVVIAHRGTREALLTTPVNMIHEQVLMMDPEGFSLMEGYRLKLPSIVFDDRLTLYLGDHTFELIHLPGHTPSEIAVYIPQERLVFTGDNVFHKVQTFLHEADPERWLHSLEAIRELDVDVLVPGHGELCGKDYLQEQALFIQEWVDAVKDAIRQGLSCEEAQERISFLDRYPMDIGLEAMGPMVQMMNVARLYDLLSGS